MAQRHDGTKRLDSDESQREDNHSRQHLTLPTAPKPTVHIRDYLSLDHPKQTANGDNAPVEKYNLKWKSRGSKWSLRAAKAATSPKGDKAPRITLAESD